MTEETRRSIFRYGIAIDLVVLAIGVGMLLPVSPRALIVTFVTAVALSAWKGGWKGGATALLLSLLSLSFAFPEQFDAARLIEFTGGALAAGAIVIAATLPRTARPVLQPVVTPANVVAFTAAPVVDEEELARESEQRQRIARRLEETATRQIDDLRAEAERQRRFEEERIAREREAAERAAQEEARRLAEEQRRIAEEEAALRAEEEHRAAEAKERERIERQRLEEERVAAERRREAEEQSAREAAAAAERAAQEAARIAEEQRRVAVEQPQAETRERAGRQKADKKRAAAERRREADERAAREAAAAVERAAQEAARLAEEQRRIAAEEALRKAEEEHRAAEAKERERLERQRLEAERAAQEAQRLLEEQRKAEEELAAQLIREREEAQRALTERIEAERKAAEEELQLRLEAEREALKAQLAQQLATEREAIEREAAARVEAAKKAAEEEAAKRVAAIAVPEPKAKPVAKPAAPKGSFFEDVTSTISNLFKRDPRPRTVNLKRKSPVNTAPPVRRPQPAPNVRRSSAKTTRKPRLLFLERRRPTADTAVPRLRQRGVEVSVVERWVDAVDEMFRSRPDAIVIDVEHPEFDKIHRTITDKNNDLPIILSGRAANSAPASTKRAAFVVRPYDVDELVRLAEKALTNAEDLLAEQMVPRQAASAPKPVAAPPQQPKPQPIPLAVMPPKPAPAPAVVVKPIEVSDSYEVACFTCRIPFDAVDADWCSCLAKERSLVCTNCLACFCKAPPAYKEKFWVEAPPKLFERKTSEARRQQSALAPNPDLEEVRRPLVLTVEDDEEIQAIVARVCSNLGYGFIYATNGQDGLETARAYKPNLILSDAFMPKLDGREMCRILKEEAAFDAKMVVMTGLYTDTKYRSEALKRFHVDDYISKPVAITDLVNLLQKHLEGVTGLPMQEDLHELHRQDLETHDESEGESEGERHEDESHETDFAIETEVDGIALADLLDTPQTIELRTKTELVGKKSADRRSESYEVCCFNCQNTFDATRGEWCTCVGRDQTVVCTHCSGCFCKAPAAYKERFWMDAPPMLFERKMLGSKRHHGDRANPMPSEVKRPLILLVEDDENVQLIVKTVVTTMGFGFVVGANGQEGLSLAREYNPDLILSDAFMPKLDGREMCRLLKEDPSTARSKAIIMTGLYTDRKYRNEALDYFKVDDYVAKPLAVDDLIKLFKKHLPQEAQTTN